MNSKVKAVPRAKKKQIFIIDDHPLVRASIAQLISAIPGLSVCGDAGSAEEALAKISHAKPDMAILDLSLTGSGGLELLKNLRIRHPRLRILVLSMHDEALFAERALSAGATGYIMKERGLSDLRTAINRVLDGKIYLSEAVSDRLVARVSRKTKGANQNAIETLTDRELEVFELIGKGFSTRRVAKALNRSPKTIETYRANIKEKLNLRDAADLVKHAVSWVESR